MRFLNYTPFSPLYFKCEDLDRNDMHVVILKGTFRIENGKRLIPTQKQEPICVADEYYGEPLESSVSLESDICPHKPYSDITVKGDAVAPGGHPTRSWLVGLQVSGGKAAINKSLRVYGPRQWRPGATGWGLTEPEPCTSVPMRYEYAFGGTASEKEEGDTPYEPNPVGLGYSTAQMQRAMRPFDAHRIEEAHSPVVRVTERPTPAGLGPLTKAWPQRRTLGGTYDAQWQQNVWPGMPSDFDYEFYNGAPQDQRTNEFLSGDERFFLAGMTHSGHLRFSLPGYELGLLVKDKTSQVSVNRLELDTVAIDVAKERASLTWRIGFWFDDEIQDIEAHMTGPGVSHG